MAITAAERHEIAELLVLMYNAAPGATVLSQIVSVYESVGHNLQTVAEILGAHPSYTQTHPNFWTGEDFATNLLTPLGLGADFAARTGVINAFNSGMSMADITYNGYLFLNQVAANPANYGPQYVAAAAIMNNKADVSIYYSVTKGLSAGSLAELQAVLAGVTADPASVIAAQNAIDHANDPQAFNLTVNSPTITEGDSGTKLLTFTITLLDTHGGATVGSTTINYATTNTGATATAGDDYVPTAGTVTFGPGQTTATISVTVLGDTAFEPNETIKLILTGATLVASVTGTGTITNDDPVPPIFLTPQADTILGTALGETINGTQDTFTLADDIDGAGGDDTLRLVFDGTPSNDPEVIVAPFVTVKNVEHVVIQSDLSVGSDGGEAFDMSTWTGVNTISISAAAGADVNIKSAASQSITVVTADEVTISDDTVASITVTNARGGVAISASDATTVTVGKADGYVFINTNNANVAVNNATDNNVVVFNGNGNVSVGNADNIYVSDNDATTMNLDANNSVEVDANDIGTLTITADGEVDVDANSIDTATITGEGDVHVGITNLTAWTGPLSDDFGADATVTIGGEDGGDVSVDGGSVEHVSVDGAVNVTIDAGVIGSVTIGELSDDYTTVAITTYSDGDLSLTLAGANIDELTLDGMSDVALDVTAASYAVLMEGSTVESITLTGAGDLELDTTAVDGVLAVIDGATYTGDLTLDAFALEAALSVTSGSGDDDIEIDGGEDAIFVDAGEGNNTVDVDSYGIVEVIVGDGDDDVTVNLDVLSIEGSSVDLGEGTNSLTLRAYGTIYEDALDGFDAGALPLSGNLMSLTFAADIELHQGTETTLDVGGLDGPVSFIGFGDVNVFSDSGEADLTIAGTGATLTIQSSDDFGSDDGNGMINLSATGVTALTLDISDDMNVSLTGTVLASLMANAGGSADLILDGDADGNGTADTLQALNTVTFTVGEDADLTLSHLRHSTVTTVNAGEDASVAIDYSTLGALDVHFGQNGDAAAIEITGTQNSTVTVGNITVNDDAVTTTDADNNNSVYIEVSDNDFSTVLLGTVTATADGDIDATVSHNRHSTLTAGAVALTSRFNNVSLTVSDNTDNEVGADASVTFGNVTLSGEDGAQLEVLNNVDAAVTLGNVTMTSEFANQWINISGNDESQIKLGNIAMTSGYGASSMMVVFSDNDGAELTTGNITIDTEAYGATSIEIYGMSETEVNIGDVLVTAASDVTIFVGETTDSAVDIGNVTLTSTDGDVLISVSDNTGGGSIGFGNVNITATEGDVTIFVSDGQNFDTDVSFGTITIAAGGNVDFLVSGENNGLGETSVGAISITADGDIQFDLNNVDDGGNVTLTAGGDAFVNVHSLLGDGLDKLTVTATNEANIFVSDVSELSFLTVSAVDANITLEAIDNTGGFTLDLSGVTGTTDNGDVGATVDASLANFNSTGLFATVLIGHGDVNYTNDADMSETGTGFNAESREKFEFGYGTGTDDVGHVVIADFNPGATAAVDGVWTDRIDFSHLTGVDSLEDITITLDGDDVVIDFVNGAYGDITLTGVGLLPNFTDLVVASITF